MFGKFLKNKECMSVLTWLLNHPDGEYSGAIVAIECEMPNVNTFMAVLTILEAAKFISVNEFDEELNIKLNKDESITQLLSHLKDDFNDIAFHSDQISPALAYLTSSGIQSIINSKMLGNINLEEEEILKMFKDYKNLDLDDDVQKEIYDICCKLEETGEYEEFIKNLEEK